MFAVYAAGVDLTSITPEPHQLRALSHPVRLRILGLLRSEGPTTATALATRLGLNSGATSYHLRQLAQHGFVEDDAERGTGRERWWRASAQSTRTEFTTDPEARAAEDAFVQAVAVVHTEQLQRAVEERELVPDAWRRASTMRDWGLRLTPRRAEALMQALIAVIEETEEDPAEEEGAEAFTVVLHTFPRPGHVARAEGAEEAGQ